MHIYFYGPEYACFISKSYDMNWKIIAFKYYNIMIIPYLKESFYNTIYEYASVLFPFNIQLMCCKYFSRDKNVYHSYCIFNVTPVKWFLPLKNRIYSITTFTS